MLVVFQRKWDTLSRFGSWQCCRPPGRKSGAIRKGETQSTALRSRRTCDKPFDDVRCAGVLGWSASALCLQQRYCSSSGLVS